MTDTDRRNELCSCQGAEETGQPEGSPAVSGRRSRFSSLNRESRDQDLQIRYQNPAYTTGSVVGGSSVTLPHQIAVIARVIIVAYRCRAD